MNNIKSHYGGKGGISSLSTGFYCALGIPIGDLKEGVTLEVGWKDE